MLDLSLPNIGKPGSPTTAFTYHQLQQLESYTVSLVRTTRPCKRDGYLHDQSVRVESRNKPAVSLCSFKHSSHCSLLIHDELKPISTAFKPLAYQATCYVKGSLRLIEGDRDECCAVSTRNAGMQVRAGGSDHKLECQKDTLISLATIERPFSSERCSASTHLAAASLCLNSTTAQPFERPSRFSRVSTNAT